MGRGFISHASPPGRFRQCLMAATCLWYENSVTCSRLTLYQHTMAMIYFHRDLSLASPISLYSIPNAPGYSSVSPFAFNIRSRFQD